MGLFTEWLLIAFAIGVGWLLGFYARSSKKRSNSASELSPDAEARMRFLIDSYSRENIDSFVQSLEVSKDSLPLHLSIARHFRKNGEVEKAISVHQNLMSRPGIPLITAQEVSFELAKDYFAAGLFDRAEALLIELKSSHYADKSIRLLIDLYRKESEWKQALNEAVLLDWKKDKVLAQGMAQFCCETAIEELQKNNDRDACLLLKEALNYDKACIRAYVELAKFEVNQQQPDGALEWLNKAFEKDPVFATEFIPIAKSCIPQLGEDRVNDLLLKWFNASGAEALLIAIADNFRHKGESDKAIYFLREQLSMHPKLKGLVALLHYETEENPSNIISINLAAQVGELVLAQQPVYQCVHCGFSGSQLHWLCPSCKQWGRVKPSEFKLLD